MITLSKEKNLTMPYFKYHAKKIEVDGMKFDSKKEYNYYLYLLKEQHEGRILTFHRQVPFELLPRQEYNGRFAEHPLRYVADFVVTYLNGSIEVIDVKGYKTPEYRIKRKLMLYMHNIKIKEV